PFRPPGLSVTPERVEEWVKHAATLMTPDDIFFISFAGHGNERPDQPPTDEPTSDSDQGWVLQDDVLWDDDLYALWHHFKKGSRVLVISDCCYSGSMTDILRRPDPSWPPPPPPRVLLLASCAEDRPDWPPWTFSPTLHSVWDGGHFTGDYDELVTAVQNANDDCIYARRYPTGALSPDMEQFVHGRAFQV
ncbi:MAG: caspase family protein, partial [Armatimonadetes bacterium]|nr:caspase family protein [Armatimonadota bacterium]